MPTNKKYRTLLAALLFLITGLLYAPCLHGNFLWDDDAYISQNAQLNNLQGLHDIWLKPGSAQQYYPLTFTAFWIQHHLWGLNSFGYHLVNVLLHVLNALMLWVILSELEISGAWIAAWLFALHPVQVESVAWMTELKNVLSTFFYLGTVLCLIRTNRLNTFRTTSYVFGLLLFMGALLSKSVTVTLPVSFLLITFWLQGSFERRFLLQMIPFLAMSLGIGCFTLYYEHHWVGAQGFHYDFTLPQRLTIAGHAFWFYLGKWVHPSPIVFIYPRWSLETLSIFQYAYPLSALLFLGLLAYGRRWWGKLPFACLLFFVISLSPMLGFTSFYFMRYSFVADHFQYLASLGILAWAGWMMARALEALQVPENSPLGISVIVMLLINLGIITIKETRKYQDPVHLWQSTLNNNPDSAIAHHNLGIALSDQKDWGGAIAHLRAAEVLDPYYAQTHLALAYFASRAKRWDDAAQEYATAIQLGINDPQILKDFAALPKSPHRSHAH